MEETGYKRKILSHLRSEGVAVIGVFSTSGELDIQGAIPYKGRLLYIAIEVKTKTNYYRVMSGLREENGEYVIVDVKKLKEHEVLQVAKANSTRRKGGLALFAYSWEQIVDYLTAEGVYTLSQ